MVRFFVGVAMCVLATGCAAHAPVAPMYASDQQVYQAETMAFSEAAPPQMATRASMKHAEGTSERMVHYNGFLKLKAHNPALFKEQARIWAEQAGGYVESAQERMVVLRVPKDSFHAVFDALQKTAPVVEHNIHAEDITQAYSDVSLRIQTLTSSRDRLLELLKQPLGEQEKISLLQHIASITDTLDQLQLQQKDLASMAQYARITVEYVSFQNDVGNTTYDAGIFGWVYKLSPFNHDPISSAYKISYPSPKGMVRIKKRPYWMAESADGTVVWAQRLHNNPRGNNTYWTEVLVQRLKNAYEEVTTAEKGAYSWIRFAYKQNPAYSYTIALRAHGRYLDLVQIHCPSDAHEHKDLPSIEAMLQGVTQ